jgi:ubiquinol-cytochrome c reductase cytochrome b subunit
MSDHESTYVPKTGVEKWLDTRLPIIRFGADYMSLPTPRNLNYWWTFGGILALCLMTQIVTGIVLAMHYTPNVDLAFASVERIMRDVNGGWLIRYVHANGASMFFIAVYLHMLRGLYYGSYKAPREMIWIIGCVIFFLMIATAFLGYVLPWGQMSFWGAEVITNLIGAIPVLGEPILIWLRGGPAIDNATLNRFFSLHYLLPFAILGCVVLHLWALHSAGQNNPVGILIPKDREKKDTLPFHPYFTVKDGFAIILFLILFAIFVFYQPNALGHADNYIRPTRCRRRRTSCPSGTCCPSTRSCAPSRTSSAAWWRCSAPSACCSSCPGWIRRRCARCAIARRCGPSSSSSWWWAWAWAGAVVSCLTRR